MDAKKVYVDNVMPAQKVGSAVGMDKKQWFVAIVKNNTERKCSEQLRRLGYDTYVPVQQETRQWKNGRINTVPRVVIAAVVFLYISEQERREVVNMPFIHKFMTNRAEPADRYNRHPLVVIPDSQMKNFRFLLENTDSNVTIIDHIAAGKIVIVTSGVLKGLTGIVSDIDDENSMVGIRIDGLGYACVRIQKNQITII